MRRHTNIVRTTVYNIDDISLKVDLKARIMLLNTLTRFLQTTLFSDSLHISLITQSGRSFRTFQDCQDMPHIEVKSLFCGRQEQEQVGVPSRFPRGSVSFSGVPIAIVPRLTQSTHLCFGRPVFLLPGGAISRVFLPTYSWSRLFTCPKHLSIAFLYLSVIFSTSCISLVESFLAWYLSVWPHAHMYTLFSVTSSFFTWDLAG